MDDKDIPASVPSDWQPITNKVDLAVLGKLGEEVNELGSAIFRTIIQGIDAAEPTTGKINRQWIEDELADVIALGYSLVEHFVLDEERILRRVKLKYDYKKPWFDGLRHQEDL